MAKVIRITPDMHDQLRQDFEAYLASGKCQDGTFTFHKKLGNVSGRRAKLHIQPAAWSKMLLLLLTNDKEVGWHGLASRCDAPDEYSIHDIAVFPQQVTGTTVEPDEEEYHSWLFSHDPAIRAKICMHGHSHVNMSVGPSATDLEYQRDILQQLDEDEFYIFMIWNKRLDCSVKVYDVKNNIFFETADCDIVLDQQGYDYHEFLKSAKAMVKSAPVYASGYGSYQYGTYKGGSGYPYYPAGSHNWDDDDEDDDDEDLPVPKPAPAAPISVAKGRKTKRGSKPRVPVQNSKYDIYDD